VLEAHEPHFTDSLDSRVLPIKCTWVKSGRWKPLSPPLQSRHAGCTLDSIFPH